MGAGAMKTTLWITGAQLSLHINSLSVLSRADTVILMIESVERCRVAPYHKQKLVLVWSAMRHFAEELRRRGYEVDYHAVQPDFEQALRAHLASHEPDRVQLMADAEWGASEALAEVARGLGAVVEVVPNNLFLSDADDFQRRAAGKKRLVLEPFYRRLREQTGLLMEAGEPVSGRWNYDAENRKPPPRDHVFPPIRSFPPDAITRDVIAEVTRHFPDHFGETELFAWPVTRRQAEQALEDFLDHRLPLFGAYEDAMLSGQPAMYHSLLSPALNLGLLDPLEVCRQVEERYRAGQVPLASAEGFIRQIIGWREFMYQVYRFAMPDYRHSNALEAIIPRPYFYWDGDTDMFCVACCVTDLIQRGHNHHIQRLMVTGNFALIAGLSPQEINDWYWFAFVDAYDWVVTPNVLGLSLYADGGLVASKPYAASASYLNRMSDYCAQCHYENGQALGKRACPFNSLYWDFLARHAEAFGRNPRMNLAMSQLRRRPAEELKALRKQARAWQERLRNGERV